MTTEKYVISLVLIIIIFAVINWTQKKPKSKIRKVRKDKNSRISDLNLLYDRAGKEFLSLEVKKFENEVVICEKSIFNKDPKNLVFITLNPSLRKSVSKRGDFVVARYPYVPSSEEMRQDFARVLNKY